MIDKTYTINTLRKLVQINSVNPGLVRTHIHIDNQIVEDEQAYKTMLEKATPRYPLQRIGEPEEIADLILFLLSNQSSWITGSIFKIDGGSLVYNDLIPPKKM